MTTPKVFTLDGVNKVFQSDVSIKGLEFVAVYISITGATDTYKVVPQNLYSIINDSVVFETAPEGLFLRLIVGTNRAELLNSPSNISTVAVNMEAINFVATNIDSIVDAYNVIATAENINVISNVGLNITPIINVSNIDSEVAVVSNNVNNIVIVANDISNVNTVALNVNRINSVGNNIDNVNNVGNNITNVNNVGSNIDNVNNVVNSLTNINIVAQDLTEPISEINTVANSIVNVDKVGNNIDNVNILANNIGAIVNKAKFKVRSDTSLLLDVKTNPKHLNLISLPDMVGFEVHLASNSLKNTSGRDLDIIGTTAIQITSTATSDIFLYIYSETSTDGTTWTPNASSLREIKINKAGVDYITVPSLLVNSLWLNGSYHRFKFYKEGVGDLTISAISDTVGGNTLNGHSFLWAIHEI